MFYETKLKRVQGGFTPGIQLSIVLEVNTSLKTHQRSVYTFWDFLGDVGGLNDILCIIGQWLVLWIQLIVGSGFD